MVSAPAHAQLVSPQSVLTSETAVGHSTIDASNVDIPTVFGALGGWAPGRSDLWNSRLLTLGYNDSSTVRTVRAGIHIGDLFGGDETFGLAYAAPHLLFARGVRLDLRLSNGGEAGDQEDVGSGKRTTASIKDDEIAARLAFQAGRGAIWMGYEADNDSIPGNSDSLGGSLPLFDPSTSPSFNWHWARRGGYVGASAPIGNTGIVVQGDFSPRLEFPGSFSATAITANAAATAVSGLTTPAELTLPFNTSGSGWDLFLRMPAGVKTEISLWSSRFDASGTGNVTRGDVPGGGYVGGETSSLGEATDGFAIRRQLTARNGVLETLTFTYHATWTEFSTKGLDLPAADLGFVDGQFDAAYYHLDASAVQRSIGLSWDKPLTGERQFGLDYRWLETPLLLDYGYAGREFLYFDIKDEQWAEPNARGHLLQGRYDFPIGRGATRENIGRRPVVDLAALQIIPLATTRSTGSHFSSHQPARQTSGGWDLSASVKLPF